MRVELFGLRKKEALLEELHEELLDVAPGESVVLTGISRERGVIPSVRVIRNEEADRTRILIDRIMYTSELVIGENGAFVQLAHGYKENFLRDRGLKTRIASGLEYLAQAVSLRRRPEGLPVQVHELHAALGVVREGMAARRVRTAA